MEINELKKRILKEMDLFYSNKENRGTRSRTNLSIAENIALSLNTDFIFDDDREYSCSDKIEFFINEESEIIKASHLSNRDEEIQFLRKNNNYYLRLIISISDIGPYMYYFLNEKRLIEDEGTKISTKTTALDDLSNDLKNTVMKIIREFENKGVVLVPDELLGIESDINTELSGSCETLQTGLFGEL